MRVGDELMMVKPTGSLVSTNLDYDKTKNLWLFATGTGIAPFIGILRDPWYYEICSPVSLLFGLWHTKLTKAYDTFLGDEADILILPHVTRALV